MDNLYVPVTVKAMMVGEWPARDWCADLSDDYSRFAFDGLGEFVPGSIAAKSDVPKGIHLHWSLPDALTNGKQDDELSTVRYPRVPNRWQVTRIWINGGKIKTRHWIIESDYKASTRHEHNSDSPAWPDKNRGFCYAGRAYPAETSPGKAEGYWDEFTISTPGDPVYTAFYPSCRNVFAFYDNLLENGTRIADSPITYCVCGWYGDAKTDILVSCKTNAQLLGFLSEMGWAVLASAAIELEADSEKSCAYSTLCHGMICGLNWKNDETMYQELDGIMSPDVSVGNSSPEALAALLAHYDVKFGSDKPIEYGDKTDERMLLHLLCGSRLEITELDGIVRSENSIHESFFVNSVFDKRYTLKAIEGDTESTAVEPEEELMWELGRLNCLETDIALLGSEIEHNRELLFDALYKKVKGSSEASGIGALCDYLDKLLKELIHKEKEFKDSGEKIRILADGKFNLTAQGGERFWEPSNPAFLLSHIARDHSHGEDGRFDKNRMLLTRVKTVESLTLEGGKSVSVGDIDLGKAKHGELIRESILMSPDFAGIIDSAFKQELNQLQCAPYASAMAEDCSFDEICEALSYPTLPPSKVAVSYYSDSWYPLFFDWRVFYFPDRTVLAETPDLKAWEMSEGYDFTLKDTSVFSKTGVSMGGRTFLTAYTAKYLADKLEELGLTVPDSAWIEVLSQILGSFNDQLLMRDTKITPNVEHIIETLKLPDSEKIKELLKGYSPMFPVFDTIFSPVRAGFVSIDKISIVDSFGRLKQYRPFDCYTSEAMRFPTARTPNRVLLPPRITQPSRMTFKWDEQPIVAWIMPNFLENSASVFDATGQQICALFYVKGKTIIRHSPQNGGKLCHDISEITKDIDLHGFLTHLMIEDRFIDLMGYINNSFERINTPQNFGTLAFLAGRPLAIAKAQIALELRDPPKEYKRFAGETQKVDIEKLAVSVMIGQPSNHHDGVIGAFTDRNYQKMLLPAEVINKDKYFQTNGTFKLFPRWRNLEFKAITLLLDPCAEVCIRSGLLPVKTVRLPEASVEEYIKKLYHVFFVAPLICDGVKKAIPLPVVENTQWKWLENQLDSMCETDITRPNTKAVFDNAENTAREGWIKLSAAKRADTNAGG